MSDVTEIGRKPSKPARECPSWCWGGHDHPDSQALSAERGIDAEHFGEISSASLYEIGVRYSDVDAAGLGVEPYRVLRSMEQGVMYDIGIVAQDVGMHRNGTFVDVRLAKISDGKQISAWFTAGEARELAAALIRAAEATTAD